MVGREGAVAVEVQVALAEAGDRRDSHSITGLVAMAVWDTATLVQEEQTVEWDNWGSGPHQELKDHREPGTVPEVLAVGAAVEQVAFSVPVIPTAWHTAVAVEEPVDRAASDKPGLLAVTP
jgi:hypothetical protein